MKLVLDKDDPLATKVQTRDGREAEILSVNVRGASGETIAARVNEGLFDAVFFYHGDGKYNYGRTNDLDLINVPQSIHGWVNVYRGDDDGFLFWAHHTKEKADNQRIADVERIACIEIKGNVGDGL